MPTGDVYEAHRDGFLISTDPARLDIDAIFDYLSNRSYWAQGRPRAVVECSIRHSLCFGLYDGAQQAGFCRVITDYATSASLVDVFILEGYRGRGLGKWLVESALAHPDLQGLRKWMLATNDAHGLYTRFGFRPLAHPEWYMERLNPGT